ncbi:MAG TPA: ABC transporter ATP-binding protein, partial [Pseudonocardiaceae bacterium]
MSTTQFVFTNRADTASGSGITGSTEFPEPGKGATKPGLRGRMRTWASAVTGLGSVAAVVWKASPRLTTLLGFATVLSGLVPVLTAAIARVLINAVVDGVADRAGFAAKPLDLRLPFGTVLLPTMTPTTAIIALAVAQLLVYQLSSMSSALRAATQQLLQERVSQVIRGKIMAHAATLDLAFFEGSKSYDLLRQAQQEAAARPVTIVNGAFGLVQTLITFVTMIALLLVVSPWLALIAVLAPLPAFVADARYGTRAFLLATLTSPAKRRMDYLSSLVTTDRYAKEVTLFGLGPYLTERFTLLGGAYYAKLRTLITARQFAAAAWNSVSVLAGTGTYLYIALRALHGELTLGDLTLYTAAASTVQTAIQGIFQGLSTMHENSLYLRQLFDLLAMPTGIATPEHPTELPATPTGRIEFDHVSFRYPGAASDALHDVSFTIGAGEIVALVGRNGSGKSTLAKLLCRLYDPTQGRILLDGVDLRDLDPATLRTQVRAMFQDYAAFQATAAENIGLGDIANVTEEPAIRAAAAKAGATEIVDGLADGLDTMLGKWFGRGTELSGGQWQKIALARAFMRAGALTVLDEPTSALDARAEADLFARLTDLSAGGTTVYISHRFSTVRRADRILVLDEGELIEEGTHEQLVGR